MKLNDTALAFGMMLTALLGCFFLCLNPSETATEAQFYLGLIASKAAMAGCWTLTAKLYRRLYNLDGKGGEK